MVLTDSLLGLADQVRRSEARWRGFDAALVELRRLANEVNEDLNSSGSDKAAIFLEITSSFVSHLAGLFNAYQVELRQVRQTHGEDDPETQSALIDVFHAFRPLWVWKHALDAGMAALVDALNSGDNPANAALRALVQTVHDLDPLLVAWLAKKAPDEGARADMLVALAARVKVRRAAGDTGLRLYPSLKRALLQEATELNVPIQTVLRGQLPGAALLAISADQDVPDLRTIRSRVMKTVAPRAPRSRPNLADSQPNMMAWPSDSPRATGADGGLEGGGLTDARPATRSAEAVALDELQALDFITDLQMIASRMPPRQRQIIAIQTEWVLSKGIAPTATEIGAVLGIAPATVRVQLSRIRANLSAIRKYSTSDVNADA